MSLLSAVKPRVVERLKSLEARNRADYVRGKTLQHDDWKCELFAETMTNASDLERNTLMFRTPSFAPITKDIREVLKVLFCSRRDPISAALYLPQPWKTWQ